MGRRPGGRAAACLRTPCRNPVWAVIASARTAVEVRAWLTEDAVMFEVTDDGPGFDPTVPRSTREIDPLAERGRGLFIVAALVDECTIESGPNGTIVRCYVAR